MPESVNSACRSPRRTRPPLPRRRPVRRRRTPAGIAIAAVTALAAAVSLTGCAKMDAALGQQWFVVQFNPNTAAATARQVAKACSHVPNLRLAPIQLAGAGSGIVESMQYNATNASDADMAELQTCLQRFPSVQSVGLQDAGDSG